jgi:intracellular septation protein
MLKFISEFGPWLAFFLGYRYGGMKLATMYAMGASCMGISLCYLIDKKVHNFSLLSFVLLAISGTLTLVSGDHMFVKIKPTILYLIFAVSFSISAMRNRPLVKTLFREVFDMQDSRWKVLSYRFAGFFVFMAIVNEAIWRNFDELLWVKFKVFGVIPITILFILLQVPFLLKNKIDPKSDRDVS